MYIRRVHAFWVMSSLALASLLALPGRAVEPVPLDPARGCLELSPWLELLEDPERRWTPERIAAGEAEGLFRPFAEECGAPGPAAYAAWLRLRLEPTGAPGERWLLELSHPQIYQLSVHQVDSGGEVRPLAELGYGAPRWDLRPALPLEGHELLLWIRSDAFSNPVLRACTPEALRRGATASQHLDGLVQGLLLAVLLLNLVLGLRLRDRRHLLLALGLLPFNLHLVVMRGWLHALLPGAQHGLLPGLTLLFMAGSLACVIAFTRRFLDTRRLAPRMDLALRALAWAILAANALLVLSIGAAAAAQGILVLAYIVCEPWAGVLALLKGARHARMFLAGWVLSLPLMAAFLLFMAGVTPDVPWTFLGAHLAMLVLSLFLTLGLIDLHRFKPAERLLLVQAGDRAQSAERFQAARLLRVGQALRLPLARVRARAESLLGQELSAPQREHARLVLESARALGLIVDDLRNLEALDAGRSEVVQQPFDPARALGDAVDLLAPQARARGLALELRLEPGLPARALGDAGRLRQVVTNLVGNALKFTHQGGVEVRAGPADQGGLRVEVRDTGPGIPEPERARLFQPFSRLASTAGGTGLGLYLSKQLLAGMGGRIGLESQAGQGSTFWFELPLPVLDATPATHPAKILVVEDNPINQKLALAYLERLGLSGQIAPDGESALALVRAEPIDLVLLDLQLPGMDGYETARRILAEPPPHPVLVAWTAHALEDDQAACRSAGMQAHLTKPTSLEEMRAVLNRWLKPRGGPP